VPLGVNTGGYEMRAPRAGGAPFTVGYFARVAPEKGLHLLAEAYVKLREHLNAGEARLEVAGYLGAEHKGYLEGVERRMREAGLASEFNYRGVLDREGKIEFLRGLDVLSVPATYDEPKGIFLLEAMACGVPVVQPRRGAFTEVVERTRGGLLVEPDDAEALAGGLLRVMRDPSLASELSANAFGNVRRHYTAARMADRALEVYADVLSGERNHGDTETQLKAEAVS
jgi:glycosyltransferase involved in cell wall biosynthesis